MARWEKLKRRHTDLHHPPLPTNNLTEMSCDCPICPLVAANSQVCDVVVTVIPKKKRVYARNCPAGTEALYSALVMRQVLAMREMKQVMEVGHSYSWEKSDHEYTIYVLKKDQYRVCFHVRTLEDEDPV